MTIPWRYAWRGRARNLLPRAVLVAALVAACSPAAAPGGGGGGGGTAGTPAGATSATKSSGGGVQSSGKVVADVCGLLSLAEIKAQFGVDFPAGKTPEVSGSTTTCDWELEGLNGGIVSLQVEEFSQGVWDIGRNGSNARPVAGLGDDAFFGTLNELQVRKGNLDFVILVTPVGTSLTPQQIKDGQVTLAKAVLERIP